MDSKLFIERVENEFELAKIIFEITSKESIQKEVFYINQPLTSYSAVISHSYYCIFYCAKAYLLKKGIVTDAPEEHKKTYEAFRELVEEGVVDVELLRIYEKIIVKADYLLGIFKSEKKKRGDYTYQLIPQANKEPAEESLSNTKAFFSHIYSLCQEK